MYIQKVFFSLGIDVLFLANLWSVSGSNKTCIQMVSFIRQLSWFQMIFITYKCLMLTLEWLPSFMNSCNMFFVHNKRKNVVTKVALDWFLSFMNWCNLFLQLFFLLLIDVANITLKRLILLFEAYLFNVLLSTKLHLQKSH